MKEVDRSHALEKPPKWMGWSVGVGIFAAYVAAAMWTHVDPGKRDFAAVSFFTMYTSIAYFWDLRRRAWFWCLLSGLALLHAAAIAAIPLPPLIIGHGTGGGAGIMVWLFDSFLVYCCVKLAERASLGWPATIEVSCRVCGKDVDKSAVKCPYCGTWHPAPQSEWIVLIALAPMFITGVVLWLIFGIKH